MDLKECLYFLLLPFTVDTVISTYANDTCKTTLADRSKFGCSDYSNIHPYRDKYTLDNECKIAFTAESKEYFTYKVAKFKYRFVNLRFHFCNYSSTIQFTRCAIQPLEWVWTFGGARGGKQYLEWPAEYETLSLGMLRTFTSLPLHVNITVEGKCDNKIVIGEKNTTERFALAFADFFHELAMWKDQYNNSFWCFKTRIYIDSYFLYQLCKHVICPIETIGYKCCKQIFDVNTRNTTIECPGNSFKFGSVWWICPFVIGVILYLYFALVIGWILSNVYRHLDGKGDDNRFMDIDPDVKQSLLPSETTPLIQESENCEIAWIYHNPITVFSILASPIRRCFLFHPITTSRIIRCLSAISSLAVISVKVFVHFIYHRDFIIESVKMGAPKDFLSVIAGYELSKDNFLRYLGGPYNALTTYIVCLLIFISVPRDLAEFLETGLPVRNSETVSPLWMDLRLRERFGSRRVLSNYGGYAKIHQTMLANIFALLNPCFWGYIISLQLARFRIFTARMNQSYLKIIFVIVVGIFYFLVCIIEVLLTIVCFGLPTVFAITTVFKAYIKSLYIWLSDKGSVGTCILIVSFPCVLAMLLITVYMFSIIFVDSFIFIAKVAIFTYTGLFVNPSYTEGWVIFGITVTMYIYESIHAVNDTYEQLFLQTKKVCKRKGKKLRIMCHLYKKEVEGAGIPVDLYKYIVHTLKPIRIEVFVSIIKICIIIFGLYISLGILVNFDGFQELNVVTQTATTIFVSFVPKILKRMCSLNTRRTILRMRRKIDELVDSYLVYKGINMDQENILERPLSERYPTYDI